MTQEMAGERQFAVLGPLQSGIATRAFLGVELVDGESSPERPVVIVWLPDEITDDQRQMARLQRETAFVTQLRHPNLIDVHGLVHFQEGWARLVEFVDGEPLSRILRDAHGAGAALSPTMAARVLIDACDGVAHAHEEGMSRFNGRAIVHGGIRPDTLMVGFDGGVRVTGYGAAVLAPTAQGAPVPAILPYLAPEQILGGRATASPATDVYALGTVLFEMVAGHPPFSTASDVENAILAEPPPLSGESGLAQRLGEIAARSMAKRGPDRFETVDSLKEATVRALAEAGEPLPAKSSLAALVHGLIPPTAPERVGRKALLASSLDPDAITVLTPISSTLAGPAPFATRLRAPLPREPETVIEEGGPPRAVRRPPDDAAPGAVGEADSPPDPAAAAAREADSPPDPAAAAAREADSPPDPAAAAAREADSPPDPAAAAAAREAEPLPDAVEMAAAVLGRAQVPDASEGDDDRLTEGRIPIADLLSSDESKPGPSLPAFDTTGTSDFLAEMLGAPDATVAMRATSCCRAMGSTPSMQAQGAISSSRARAMTSSMAAPATILSWPAQGATRSMAALAVTRSLAAMMQTPFWAAMTAMRCLAVMATI